MSSIQMTSLPESAKLWKSYGTQDAETVEQ